MSHDQLIALWFLLIAVLWIGFFVLEGFDFGVAMLYPVIGKDPTERRVMINSIGPTWDANEVWLLTAGGAMFAAFPGWYATLFSGLYLALLLVLVGLIIRGISFEYRALMPDDNWRDSFDASATIGSLIVTLVFGVAFANMWKGMPVAGDPPHMTEGLLALFSPFALLGALVLVTLFMVHGGVFLSLKTDGSVREKAHGIVKLLGPVALALLTGYILIGNIVYPGTRNAFLGASGATAMWVVGLGSVVCLAFAVLQHARKNEGLAFLGTALSIATLFVTHFIKMYGTLGFISMDQANPFNMHVAASSPATLRLMSIAALIGVPIVLAYTVWSYWVFRRRISTHQMPPEPSAQATLAQASER